MLRQNLMLVLSLKTQILTLTLSLCEYVVMARNLYEESMIYFLFYLFFLQFNRDGKLIIEMLFPFPDPSAMGFIISPWSLLLMPSGNISFTDEYVTQQDLRAFTAPEVLKGNSLTSVSDIEKV